MIEANNDCRHGTTINDDNVIFEMYPYQVYKQSIEYYSKKLNEEIKK
jgi:hypothetical protein